MFRRLGTLILIAALAAAGWGVWRMTSPSQAAAVPATAEVTRGDVRRTVLAAGVIEASSLVSVGAQVSGQIESLAVTLGQRVQAGDLIAQIDPEDQQNELLRVKAALAQIDAQIAAQQASIREAELSLARKTQLNERQLTATQELEAAEAQLQVARATLAADQAGREQAVVAVQSAEVALERTRITAPSAGTVVAIVAREGQTLNAAQSSPTIVKIANLDAMVVKAEISEADVVKVAPGLPASFALAGAPDRRFDATLRAIEPAPASIETSDDIDTSTAIYYNAALDVPNPDGILRIGMTAEVTIVLDQATDVLTVPNAAVTVTAPGQGSVQVYAPATGATETRQVSLGLTGDSRTEVAAGLAAGERVLTGGLAAAPGAAATERPRGRRGPSLF